MIVIPAIDVRGGRAVRLVRGRPEDETVYADDPTEVAAGFAMEGAAWIHVVDLDAALGGEDNRSAIRRLIRHVKVQVQVGGGLRSLDSIEDVVRAGAARVILGTEAVSDDAFLRAAVGRYGDRIVVGLDVEGEQVRVRGWTESAGSLDEILPRLAEAGAPRFLVTAIARDGTLQGPDLPLYERALALSDRPVIASGGVGALADLAVLAGLGAEAAVVGKALYEGSFRLTQAIQAVG